MSNRPCEGIHDDSYESLLAVRGRWTTEYPSVRVVWRDIHVHFIVFDQHNFGIFQILPPQIDYSLTEYSR